MRPQDTQRSSLGRWPSRSTARRPKQTATRAGRRVVIAAHGNSLRALVMQLDQLSREAVLELNIPTGAPLLYEFDKDGKVLSHRYL